MNTIEYHPIGIIHTPFKTPEGTPIQPPGGMDDCAVVEVFPEFRKTLHHRCHFRRASSLSGSIRRMNTSRSAASS